MIAGLTLHYRHDAACRTDMGLRRAVADVSACVATQLILTLTHGVQCERFRDGFAIDGQRYIDPEGKITSDGFDAQSGDLAYLAETRPGESLVKVGRALSNADPMTIATAQKQGRCGKSPR